ncbi:outer membrane protein transport protein [Nitrospiraceae bacterium AH_259_D15_M11_P09]|nr:outer membrane protein transport protein [Nitrospiraceae bacterium AH_259_D15_M11_P09]
MKILERLSVLKPSVPGPKRASQIPLADNRRSRTVAGWTLLFWMLCMLVPDVVRATNGLNLIGSGGISSALAGADTAVATDFTSMNTNPAGMTQIRGTHAGFDVGVIKPLLRHKDGLNDKDGENDPLVIPNLGYIRHLTGTPVTLGIGFFTVGGNATDFRDLSTQFLTTDKTGTHIRHYKLTPSIAYEVTDKLSLGTALAISFSDISLTVLPNTSVPGVFKGFETTGTCNRANALALPGSCGFAFAFTPKIGAMYKPNEMVTLGLAYTAKSNLPYRNGRLTRNQGPVIGKVTYDADVSGFKWAEDLAFGIALRPNSRLLIATKFQWINWDAALNNVVVNLRNGDKAPTSDTIILEFKWRNQYVAALGVAYDVNDRLNLRGGYNFGNNPVPKSTLDPINATIVEHHIAAGAAYKFMPSLSLDTTFTYSPPSQRTYDSLIYGSNTLLEVGGYEFQFTLSYWN